MARCLAVLAVFLAACGARADELHKCAAADGAVSYQSAPCAATARTLWVRRVAPETTPVRPTAQVAAGVDDQPGARKIPARVRTASRRDAKAERCAAARRSADVTRDKLWNRLTFKQRSDLDARVARACAQ
jgi:hypothetical protein